jgi:3-phosphoglycerate kinase
MKKHTILLFAGIICLNFLHAQDYKVQKVQQNSELLARKIAQKMQDSLNLSTEQRKKIYDINLLLQQRKMQARAMYTNRDSIGRQLQIIEHTRDSLYNTVISAEKMQLYKSKKRVLINNGEKKN